MTTAAAPVPGATMTPAERRALVQSTAARTYGRRRATSVAFLAALALALAVAFVPLVGVLWTVIGRGISYISWRFLTTPPQFPDVFHPNNIGGISNGITATVECTGIAIAIAFPLGLLAAIAMYESKLFITRWLRTALEVMIGMPSILFGLFALLAVVGHMNNQLTMLAGSVALAMVMLPLIAVASEDALRSVPPHLSEAALALGAKRSRTMYRVVLPYARPRVLTGTLLALSRAVGETAPIVFVMGTALATNWNPLSEASTLTGLMWYNFSGGGPPAERDENWGIALVLIVGVFLFNLASRVIVAFANKGQNQ